MTTTFHLVRHGVHDRVDRVLCGRMEGVGLSERGRRQVEDLSAIMDRDPVDALYSSPIQRCLETAHALSANLGVEVRAEPGLAEVDFGAWTGLTFDRLAGDPLWEAWNTRRSLARAPGGETMGEAQARAARAVEGVRTAFPESTVMLVTHADVIKALVCLWLGLGLDGLQRFEVAPASLTTAVVGDWGAKLVRLNEEPRL